MTLEAVKDLELQAIVLWPNSDAGSEDISRGIRIWRELKLDNNMHFFKNLPIEDYIFLMTRTSCLLGNSSSGIREGAFLGTPVVNIGSRQSSRDRGNNVIDVDYSKDEIKKALIIQLNKGKYKSEPIYGDGKAGKRIADILYNESVNIQKRITY